MLGLRFRVQALGFRLQALGVGMQAGVHFEGADDIPRNLRIRNLGWDLGLQLLTLGSRIYGEV